MSRISARLQAQKKGSLIAYVMAGYPSMEGTVRAVRGLVAGGADVIELGFPFSDPMADGPAIQNAAAKSLKGGMTMKKYLDLVAEIRRKNPGLPLVMMTYSNILYMRGYAAFARRAVGAGIDGFILPDMPPEESAEYADAARAAGADAIFLASPNTQAARLCRIASLSRGFLYLVAVYGTTGARSGGVQEYTVRAIRAAKKASGGLPVGVGFGISSPADAKRCAAAGADAVIIGSAILGIMDSVPAPKIEAELESFARKIKAAM